jgi:hypothetical protein
MTKIETSIRSNKRRPEGERGFALLVVFLVAAGILISLYMEIPRVAFESQRNLEQTLIDRGEQYSRGIEVFYRKNKRYPQKIEELESFNNMRFLRRRYLDPMTGKDEWRMIHMGPGGQLSDSLIPRPAQNALNNGQANGQANGQGTGQANGQPNGTGAGGVNQPFGNQAQMGQPGQAGQPGQPDPNGIPGQPVDPNDVNVAMNRMRASDKNAGARFQQGGGGAIDPNNPNAQPTPPQYDQNGNLIPDPNQVGGNNSGFNPNGSTNPSGPGFNQIVNQNSQQGGYNQPGQPGFNPNLPPTYPNQPGINPGGVQAGNNGQNTFNQNTPNYGGTGPGQFGPQNGQNPQSGFSSNPALNSINNQLRNTTGGASGFGQQPQQGGSFSQNPTDPNAAGAGTSGFGTALPTSQMSGGGQTFGGGGIAGVASTQPGVGIKRYNDRKKYKEWEFVYDYTKVKATIPGATNPMGTNAANGTTGTSTSGFGSSGTGSGSGFGSSGSSGSGFGATSTSGFNSSSNPPATPPPPTNPPPNN